jgi:hypothetical protein
MIDNQKIKFLLLSRMNESEYPDFEIALSQALPLIDRQANSMGRILDIHVLRLAEPLSEFSKRFKSRLSPALGASLSKSMNNLLEKVLRIGGEASLQDDERRLLRLLK